MKKLSKFLGLVIAALMVSVAAKAVPAYPKPVTFTQPNGETVTITLKGDEHIHWAVSEDGYTLLTNSEGYMTYAYCLPSGDMVPTNVIASDVKKRSNSEIAYLQTVKKGLSFSKAQFAQARAHRNMVPTQNPGQDGPKKSYLGTQKVVVLLVSFTDVTFSHTAQDFDNLYNQLGYSTGGATGSVRDFYRESSYGQMDLQADVYGPIPLSHNRAYYGANTSSSGGSDQRPADMVREAVLIADTMFNVDYSRYDVDNDGWVDVINVVFAGHGEEAGTTSNAIWSHQWNIQTTTLDGKKLSKYSCSPECRGASGSNISRIGVVCHELGHVFGAADYYDIDYSGYDGTGSWDIMASGSWNNSGTTPAHHNPYVKIYDYGWVTPRELDFPASVVMQPSEQDKDAYYIVRTATNNEFFILENKQKIGFDTYIPGHGLVIYRKGSGFSDYGPNDGHPQGFYPVCANSSYSIPTSSTSSYGNIDGTGLPFPGTSNKTQFTDATTPTMKAWNGTPTNKPITKITEDNSNKTITFDFMGGQAFNPFEFTATYNAPTTIDLAWRPFSYKGTDYDVMLVYNTVNQFGTPANTTYNVGQTIYGGGTVLYVGSASSFAHTNIQQSQHYYYKLYSIIPRGPIFEYSSGVTADAATGCATVVSSFPIILDFEDEISNQCWTVTAGSQISWARGTASDNSRGLQPNGSYFGFCKLNSTSGDITYLTSPQLDFSSCLNPKIYFDYSNEKWSNDQDILTVEYRQGTSTSWTVAQTYNTNAAGWHTDSIALPANCTQVRFKGNPRYGYGLFLDDVRIGAQFQSGDDADCAPAHDLAWEITNQSQMKLHWKGEASSYVVNITNKTDGSTNSYTVNDTLFIVPNINTRAVYTWTVMAICSNAMGEAIPGGDFTMLPIDVEIVKAEDMISVYPNPARETLRVTAKNVEEKTSCEVFDVNGAQLINFEILPGETLSFDVTSWPQGTYFLRSRSKSHIATQRVIKL